MLQRYQQIRLVRATRQHATVGAGRVLPRMLAVHAAGKVIGYAVSTSAALAKAQDERSRRAWSMHTGCALYGAMGLTAGDLSSAAGSFTDGSVSDLILAYTSPDRGSGA